MLNKYAEIFDRYRIESLRLTYHPSVGTTTGGTIALGADWDPRSVPKSLSGVLACVPKVVGPCWKSMVMSLPASQLMSRKLLYTYRKDEADRPIEDSSGVAVVLAHNLQNVAPGYVVADYSIYFEGPYSGN